ncbi:MAG TPA: elongation factor Ts [Bacteroidetes bacterium]|nr:elongation factor Ts [Bacteroidota bacterium]
MGEISAADVSKLRKMTGAGMMDCKKALQEAAGDFEKAVEIIRKKGQAVATKRADHEASEGVVLAKVSFDAQHGAMVALNCETDFVAKNDDFVNLAGQILDLAIEKQPADLEELKKLPFKQATVEEVVVQQIGIIGEKIELSFYDHLTAPQVTAYIHPGNKLATLVGLNQKDVDKQVGKDVAMQVAAMNPVAVDKSDVAHEILEKEREIARDQTKNDPKNVGKPDEILERITEGKLQKFLKENTLLNQDFIKENKKSVGQYLKEVNPQLTVSGFLRYSLRD